MIFRDKYKKTGQERKNKEKRERNDEIAEYYNKKRREQT